jgi:hypothetical protein
MLFGDRRRRRLELVAAERARDFPQKPVYLLGTGERVETPMVSHTEDLTSSRAFPSPAPPPLPRPASRTATSTI